MKISFSSDGFADSLRQQASDLINLWGHQQLEPLISKMRGEPHLYVSLKQNNKGATKYTVLFRLHLPRRAALVSRGEGKEFQEALSEATKRLIREVERHKERLHGQAEYRRKARRARLRQLKAAQATLPAESSEKTRSAIEPLLPQVERIIRRELAYLRANGDLPAQDPTLQDVLDEAVLAVIAQGKPDRTADMLLRDLLREAFKVLDREVDARRCFGDVVSLESAPEPDAVDQAEAMVEEEIYEFYQPDEALQLADVLPDENASMPDVALEADERDYAMSRLVGLPILWRRVWMLSELERLAIEDIAGILEIELTRARNLLIESRDFIKDHLWQSGLMRE